MRNVFPHIINNRGSRGAVLVAALTCLVIAAASCRTIQTVEVPVYVHDTTYVTHNIHDSVFVENNTVEYVKGDTVFLVKTKTKYVEKTVHDTLVRYVEKPIEVVKEKTEYVEKKLTWMQKTLIGLGVCFVLSLMAGIAMFVIGLKKK